MGSSLFQNYLSVAINSGMVPADAVTNSLKRVLRAQFNVGRFDPLSTLGWRDLGFETLNSTYHQQVLQNEISNFILEIGTRKGQSMKILTNIRESVTLPAIALSFKKIQLKFKSITGGVSNRIDFIIFLK
eukprot:c17714_g2_i1.p1 GENE.c17714_g2_i1~~c17714_g2_i1.p1  ORF type:complete len:130 (+),score=23.45 c17714_g2_i1:271-660(+)